MNVESYDQIIDSWSCDLLLQECKSIENLGMAANYWVGLDDIPGNSIEKYVQDCFDFYLKDQYPTAVGLEWWFHSFVEDDKMLAFHFDCDETVRMEENRMVLPLRSTVTYLNLHRSPTIVTNVVQNSEDPNNFGPKEPTQVVYSVPGPGKFFTFHSKYLHGVTDGNAGRVTLMYNVWDHLPQRLHRCPYTSNTLDSHFYKCYSEYPQEYLGKTKCCKIGYYDVECTLRYPSMTNYHDTWIVNQ